MILKPPKLTPLYRKPRGLVGDWPMNEGSGNLVNDLSGNGNTGTLENGAIWSTREYGVGVEMFGDSSGDWIALDNAISFGNGVPWSFISAVDVDALFNYGVFWGNRYDSHAYSRLQHNNDGDLALYDDELGLTSLNGAAPVISLGWQSLAVVCDGTNIITYRNGMFVDSTAIGGSASFTINKLGAFGKAGMDSLDGQMLDAQVYNRALTASEIARLYRDPWWRFRRQRPALWSAATQGAGEEPSVYDSVFMGCNF